MSETFIVIKENPIAASTIEVAPGQRVIATGPQAIVRHSMYSGAIFMLPWYAPLPGIVVDLPHLHQTGHL